MQQDQQIDFSNQVVVITGAGRGLGRSYALAFGDRRAHVVVHDAGVGPDGTGGDESVADVVVEEIRQAGNSASASYYDIATKQGCDALIADTIRDYGHIDVLVSNAGVVRFISDEEMTEQDVESMFAVNALASLWLTLAIKPHLKRQCYGRIVYTVSGHGTTSASAPNELTAYGMSKAAVFGIMNISSGEFGESDIQLNAISPVAATRVLRRPVTGDEFSPEKVVPGVLLLASSAWSSSGNIVTAADGRFGLRRMVTEQLVELNQENLTPEALLAQWT